MVVDVSDQNKRHSFMEIAWSEKKKKEAKMCIESSFLSWLSDLMKLLFGPKNRTK